MTALTMPDTCINPRPWTPMVNYQAPTRSYLTAHDFFCGAGGGALALDAAGVEIAVSVNHWQKAIETHSANFPHHEHDLTDITQVNPARYPYVDIALMTPECKTFSPGRGEAADDGQLLLWEDVQPDDPATARSRMTMGEVYRFTAYHRYKIVLVEQVVEIFKWRGFRHWVEQMHGLGYHSKPVFFNSQFSPSYPHPTPQSRDRVYYVFWRAGIGRDPDLDIRPQAFCPYCQERVSAIQSWKNPKKRVGKYGRNRQYIYRCPRCTSEVRPNYTPVAAAIDFSLPAEPVGGRKKPLDAKTIARIRVGLEKFGRQPLVLDSGFNYNTVTPRVWPISEPAPTQTTAQSMGFLVPNAYDRGPASLEEPAPTQTGRQDVGLTIVPDRPFVVEHYGTGTARAITEPCSTITAGGNHQGICVPPGFQGFLSTYYSNGWNTPLSGTAPTVTTKDRHALVESAGAVEPEDCRYRMLHPDKEIKRIMGFPPNYVVLGSQRDQTRQLGHSLSPGTLSEIVRRAIAIL